MVKIAITGPESSGKTTLANNLGEYYNTIIVQEYAREYLERTHGEYVEKDLIEMATGHFDRINDKINDSDKNDIIVVDTDFIVFDIWSTYKYGKTAELIQSIIRRDIFDLHILCKPDIPWEPDPLRENPYDRDKLYSLYERSLLQNKKEYITVEGANETRMKKVIQFIELLKFD